MARSPAIALTGRLLRNSQPALTAFLIRQKSNQSITKTPVAK
jgi:hypothetical protein